MSAFINLEKHILDALSAVCHSALKAGGLEIFDQVALLKASIQQKPAAEVPAAVETEL